MFQDFLWKYKILSEFYYILLYLDSFNDTNIKALFSWLSILWKYFQDRFHGIDKMSFLAFSFWIFRLFSVFVFLCSWIMRIGDLNHQLMWMKCQIKKVSLCVFPVIDWEVFEKAEIVLFFILKVMKTNLYTEYYRKFEI